MNKNERMEKLSNAGFDVKKYFSIPLPNGLKPGSTVNIIIDENGDPKIANNDDFNNQFMDIRNQIIKDGYVRNTKLHRRFVMAQMFRLLNYNNGYYHNEYYSNTKHGYTDALNVFYGFDYTMKMMLEEVRVLEHLQRVDFESFNERAHFFTIDVVIKTMNHYRKMLEEHVNGIKIRHCKGVPYKKVNGTNIFVSDFNKKIFYPVDKCISDLRYLKATNCNMMYGKIYEILYRFMKFYYISLDPKTKKCPDWVDAFKGEGAFYTLKNLIMYHNCHVIENECFYYGINAMKILNRKLVAYSGQGWRMFAFMKKVIDDNNFDFVAKMKEIYSEK